MVMWTRSEVPLAGNARYEGFSVDLLQRLSERIGFKYVIIPVADGKYGKPNANGEWNGMVGEVINGVSVIMYLFFHENLRHQITLLHMASDILTPCYASRWRMLRWRI